MSLRGSALKAVLTLIPLIVLAILLSWGVSALLLKKLPVLRAMF